MASAVETETEETTTVAVTVPDRDRAEDLKNHPRETMAEVYARALNALERKQGVEA